MCKARAARPTFDDYQFKLSKDVASSFRLPETSWIRKCIDRSDSCQALPPHDFRVLHPEVHLFNALTLKNWSDNLGTFECDHLTLPSLAVPTQYPSNFVLRKSQSSRLAIVIVSTPKQHKKMMYAIARWERPGFAPCHTSAARSNYGLVLIQSGMASESSQEAMRSVALKVADYPSVKRCFSQVLQICYYVTDIMGTSQHV